MFYVFNGELRDKHQVLSTLLTFRARKGCQICFTKIYTQINFSPLFTFSARQLQDPIKEATLVVNTVGGKMCVNFFKEVIII